MCDCREMQHTVRGTSKSHIHGQCIKYRILCHNIAGSDILSYKLHHLHTCMLRQLQSRRIYGRDRPVAAKSHSERFCQAVHAVCSIHTGTGATGWTCLILIFTQFFIRDSSGRMCPYRLEHTGKAGLFTFYVSCKHRTSAHKDRGDIHTCCRHQKSGHILITVRDHNKSVKLMCHSKCFCRICDKISCYKRIFHSDVSHRNTVAYCNRRNYDRSTACHSDSHLDRLCNLVKIHMSRYDLII